MPASAQFSAVLARAKGDMTAAATAASVSPFLSVRTAEDWLQGRREPPAWTHEWILRKVVLARLRSRKAGLRTLIR